MPRTMDDRALTARARAGDGAAFAQLVERHQGMVYALALGKTGHPQDAEEVVQTAFLKAWQGLPNFRGEAAFSPWLYRLTVHAAVDLLRQRRQHLSLDDPDLPPLPAGTAGPEAQVQENDRRRQLWEAIDALPDGLRTPFLLREVEGRSYQEIASELNISTKTVEYHIRTALAELRKIIGIIAFFF